MVVTQVLVVADTHVRPDTLDRIPAAVWDSARASDLILHAGDVVCRELVSALGELAPVHAVRGNNDVGRVDELPETVELDIGGRAVAMIHDSGARQGRPARMHRRFPSADIVVFGHSHEPIDDVTEFGQVLFNPGSPTQRRRQPQCSFGVLELGGRELERRLVYLPRT